MSFQNKNKKEFENVYYKNKFNVYRIAMDYSGSHKESAEEIFQEVFLKLYTPVSYTHLTLPTIA